MDVGGDRPVVLMGALNVGPESFHAGSVHVESGDLVRAGEAMVAAGASIVDVGARSTAPYGSAAVSEAEEADRLGRAVALLAERLPVPISADSPRPGPLRAALDAGARIVNDVGGLRDPAVARLVAARGSGLVLMAAPEGDAGGGDPLAVVSRILGAALARARAAGIPDERIVLDPGIGFFRGQPMAWHEWDLRVLTGLEELGRLGRPLCLGVSRKSFLGAITGRTDPADRLAGSLAATTLAVLHGAAIIRTHDVAETRDAVRVAERARALARAVSGRRVRSTIGS